MTIPESDFDLLMAQALDSLHANRLDDAKIQFEKICTFRPSDAKAWHFRGTVSALRGESEDAERYLRESIANSSPSPYTYYNLAKILADKHNYAEAKPLYEEAIARKPDFADAYNNLGVCLLELGADERAVSYCRQALAFNPNLVEAHVSLGAALQKLGKYQRAEAALAEAIRLQPSDFIKIRKALISPVIPASKQEIAESRAGLETEISRLLESPFSIADPIRETSGPAFYLAYHGLGNRILHSKISQLYLKATPTLSWIAPHCERSRRVAGPIRVGFISKFLRDHSIGKTTRGLLANMSRKQFKVYAIFVPPLRNDWISAFIQQHSDENLFLPHSLEDARKAIAALQLDVLFYQDIGMEPFTYFLAFSRLAPVQCVSFGHPDTTGIPTMDYWISNDLFEPKDATIDYSERLFLLRDLPTLAYYYRPEILRPLKDRSAFSLPAEANLYVCPQTLFKFHPDFDAVLSTILRKDVSGRLVIVEGKVKNWTELLLARWQSSMADIIDRVIVLPSLSQQDFLNLLAVCDVMLDTIHFNGMNSSLEGFAAGIPIVTMPTRFQRGRHTYGMYCKMGIEECIAQTPDEYAEIALRLGHDMEFRDRVKKRIADRADILYEDTNVVREFERFFFEAVANTSR